MNFAIVSFYKFFAMSAQQVRTFETQIENLGLRFSNGPGLRGLAILAPEGMNATFSLSAEAAESFRSAVSELIREISQEDPAIAFKNSFADKHAFRELSVKIRDEIVTLERPDIVPAGSRRHLSPEEWQRVINEESPVVIDTRNSYEYKIGHFAGAVDPETEEFNEFPNWVKKSDLPKDKKILIYCTGGIRCEKALIEMEEQGYGNVYQLDGGILNYLEKFPNQKFEGDCFVFDYRIAVDQNLKPSTQYKLCPHCGQPAKTSIDCVQCGVSEVVCETCLDLGEKEWQGAADSKLITKNPLRTCSKNCAHHARMGHTSKRIHKDAWNRRRV